MKNILFNSGTTYHKGGQKMDVVELSSIDVKNTKKEDLPWLQVFNSGYRVTTDNIDWNTWTGCVFTDIDSKKYYNDVKQFDAKRLLDLLYDSQKYVFVSTQLDQKLLEGEYNCFKKIPCGRLYGKNNSNGHCIFYNRLVSFIKIFCKSAELITFWKLTTEKSFKCRVQIFINRLR